MTALYEAMVSKLWRKDIVALGKQLEGKAGTHRDTQELTLKALDNCCKRRVIA